MKNNQYEWRLKSLAKGIDPNSAAKELKRIEKKYGALTPEIVLKASEPKSALLHNLFEWDDSQAAKKFREIQARNIINNINIVFISDEGEREIPVYEIIRSDEGSSYKHIQALTPAEIDQVRARTVRDLNALRSKLAVYKDFSHTIEILDSAIDSLGID